MTAAARRQVFQTKESSNPVLQMDDEVAFFQFGEINVERGTGRQRVRRFQPAWTLDFVAAKNFRVGDDDQFRLVTNEAARKGADVKRRTGVAPVSNFVPGSFSDGDRRDACPTSSTQISSNRCRSPSLLQKT